MINPANVKTIIVDLDRTLLHTDKTLSAYTVKVLDECKKRGIKIMVATARPLRATVQYCERIDFDAMVVSNGARILYSNQQTNFGIDERSAVGLLNLLTRHPGLRFTLETGDRAYSNLPIEDYETIISDDLVGVARKEGALKILVHLDNAEILPFVQEQLTDDLYYTIAHGYLLQIMSTAATKWNGIQAMLDICGCSPEEAAYFGDDQDDVEPIKMCGLGIAVSNGIDEVKAAADYVAESNDCDGVAKFIEHQILSYFSRVIVRNATIHDCHAICRISCEDLGYDCTPNLVATRLNSLDSKREVVFVAELDKIVVGYVHTEIYNLLYCESMVNILGIAVTASCRRYGAGTALINAVEDWAKSLGIYTVRLNSGAARSDAHAFYRAMGYNNEKDQIRFIKDLR